MKTRTGKGRWPVEAWRIAKKHNEFARSDLAGNGKLAFQVHCLWAEWYSDASYGFPPGTVVVPIRREPMSVAEAEQIWNDAEAERKQQESAKETCT